jgi:ribosomal protein S18 acetylase RimI-like enzyme
MNDEIAQLEALQIQSASEVLGDAFKDDPVFRKFAFQNEPGRLGTTQWISWLMLRYAHPYSAVYTTAEGLRGVAIWIPPKQFPLNDFRLLQKGGYALPFKLRFSKLLRFILLFFKIESCHKAYMAQPHWYLMMLGVHPDHQGQGLGSALIQPILHKADRDNIPCYLETSTERAARFYQRHGFKVVKMIDLPQENIHIWAMKREAFREMSDRVDGSLPLRWSAPEFSPFLDHMGSWPAITRDASKV